ncbi:acyltransferase family protein [Arthrobacter sp. G119Y2]|uniref:acyltransferase family protein n=1 Tax=Arthrobacter sp. G119Y2 TaxID=3134965 RepID=UPI00311A7908
MEGSRFGALDGLRAISVVGVVWHHVSGIHDIPLVNQGYRGVDFFFAISGFLITTLLLRERRQYGRISLKNFYIRRTLRIFPLYYAVLGMYCLLTAVTMNGTAKGDAFWGNLPAFATYTSNWFVDLESGDGVTFYFAWSLATEEQFYLFWPPLLVLAFWLKGKAWPAVVVALALVGLQLVAATSSGDSFPLTVLASLAPAILLGSVFAILLTHRPSFEVLFGVLGRALASPLLVVVVAALMFVEAPTVVVQLAMVLLVVSLCIREDTPLHPALRLRPLVFIGGISYGMYLLHMLAANAVRRMLGHEAGIDVFLATLALVTLIAFVSFRYFESPILKRAQRFRPGPGLREGNSVRKLPVD